MSYRKYGSRKAAADGIKFGSRAEAAGYKELKVTGGVSS